MKYSREAFALIGTRIREARKGRKMSQDEFIDLLKEHGCAIGRGRLSHLENGKAADFNLDILLTVCEIFDWDMGSLFGAYKEKNLDNHIACTVTGLSEQAVEKIKRLYEYNSRTWCLDTLNKAIEHPDFVDFIHAATEYTDKDTSVSLVSDNIAFTERESSTKDIAAVKTQRLLFRILDAIPERENDLRPLYSMLFRLKEHCGWSETQFAEHLAKLDRGDLSDFRED